MNALKFKVALFQKLTDPHLLRISTKLKTEIKQRFAKILDVTDFDYDPIFSVATFLDPRYALSLGEEHVESAIREIKRLVRKC